MLSPKDQNWDEFHDVEIVDWKRCRALIEHENNLTNHRLTWLLTSQGFLLGAFVILFQSSTKTDIVLEQRPFYEWVLAALVFIGVLVSVYLFVGLRASTVQHDKIRDWWLSRPNTDLNRHPEICGYGFGWFTDHLPSYYFALLFIIAWIVLIAIALFGHLKPYAGAIGTYLLFSVAAITLVALGFIVGRIRNVQPQKKK